ncbi:MAG TPA: hypothetical protein PKA88_09940 [Polyangiaceae bacterium]|nr:hypothetical protein [Polyangiaceae bacterium]HMR78118.1 hypothetical protein [Polyangiaceae bacterium]
MTSSKHKGKVGKHAKHGGAIRLYRIGLNGQVDVLASGFGDFKGEVFLTPGEDGTLLLAANHEKKSRHRLVQLRIDGRKARAVARAQGKARLAASPFLTRRGLTLPIEDHDGTLLVRELSAQAAFESPHHCGALWPLED